MSNLLIEMGVYGENASPQTKELSVRSKELTEKYGKETIFVSRIFSRLLIGWKPKGLLKIGVLIVDSIEKESVIPPNRFTKACVIYKYFDWSVLDNEQDQVSRYKILLELLLRALIPVSSQFEWPILSFEQAYSKVLSLDFVNEYNLLPPKASPDKRRRASVGVKMERDYSIIFVDLVDVASSSVQRKEIIKVTHLRDNFDFVTTISWLSNDELHVSNEGREILFKYLLPDQKVELFLIPRTHDESYLRDELALLNPDTPLEVRMEIGQKRMAKLMNGLQ